VNKIDFHIFMNFYVHGYVSILFMNILPKILHMHIVYIPTNVLFRIIIESSFYRKISHSFIILFPMAPNK
jgi:hypothetical protein